MEDLDALLADLQATTTAHLQAKSAAPLIEHSAPSPLDLDLDLSPNRISAGLIEKRGLTQDYLKTSTINQKQEVIPNIDASSGTEWNINELSNNNRDSGANSPAPPVPPHPAIDDEVEELIESELNARPENMDSQFSPDNEDSGFHGEAADVIPSAVPAGPDSSVPPTPTDIASGGVAPPPADSVAPAVASAAPSTEEDVAPATTRNSSVKGSGSWAAGMGSSTDIGFLSRSEAEEASPDSLEGAFEAAPPSVRVERAGKRLRTPGEVPGRGGEAGGGGDVREGEDDFNYFVTVCSPTPNRKKVIVEPAPDEVYFVTTWQALKSQMRVGRIIVEPNPKEPSPAPSPSPPKEIEPEENSNHPATSGASMGASKGADGSRHLDSMLTQLDEEARRQGVNTTPKGYCQTCQKTIVGQVVTAMGNTYHVDHFICTHCQKQLGTETFFERDSQPYCEECCHFLFSPRCAYCNEPITGKCMSALEKTWHPEHFFCAQCGTQFGEEEFHEKDEKVFCKNCFFDLFAARCKACNHPITSNYISALDGHWHNECFTCRECLTPFTGGSYFEHDGQPYCEVHYHARRGSLCAGCQKPITGRCITAMGQKFHPEHFTCSFCLKALKKGTFKEQSEKPYCHACFNKLFG